MFLCTNARHDAFSVSAWYRSAASSILATFATDTILRAECSQRTFSSSSRNSDVVWTMRCGGKVSGDHTVDWRRGGMYVERLSKCKQNYYLPASATPSLSSLFYVLSQV